MKRVLFFTLSMLFSVAVAVAETVPFNGLLCDIDGLGIKAQLSIKGSDKRTVSGKDGKFGLPILRLDM